MSTTSPSPRPTFLRWLALRGVFQSLPAVVITFLWLYFGRHARGYSLGVPLVGAWVIGLVSTYLIVNGLPPRYRILQQTNDNATWYIVQERLLWFWYANAITYRYWDGNLGHGVETRPKEYHTLEAAQRCLCNEIQRRENVAKQAHVRASRRTVAVIPFDEGDCQ